MSEVTYPRIPAAGEDLTGKVCVCSIGRPAIVIGVDSALTEKNDQPTWAGLGLDGKGIWCSRSPAILADDPIQYYNHLLWLNGRNI